MSPCPEDNKSFLARLQEAEELDLRDNRGKRHELAIVLLGLVLALLCKRDGTLSSLHRHMKSHYGQMMTASGQEPKRCISRSQLSVVLAKVSAAVFDKLLFETYGLHLHETGQQWFALDGKELRGSIESGAKRGVAVVQAVAHEGQTVQAQDYFHGRQASEVKTVRTMLAENNLAAQKVSLDALHCKVGTLQPVAAAGGVYLVGLKQNQQVLYRQMSAVSTTGTPRYTRYEVEKGHGRITERTCQVYGLEEVTPAPRRTPCNLNSLLRVERKSEEVKTGKRSEEISYYLTNQSANPAELCQAVRQHWRVEVNNQIRDVTFQEDGLRLKGEAGKQTLAGLRTLATTLEGRTGCANRVAQLEDFADGFGQLLAWLKAINFL